MKSEILTHLKQKFELSGQGETIPNIKNKFNLEYSILKPILNDFLKEKLIYTRNGINGILVYYKNKK